jgi:hypothetical protein
VPHAQRPEHGAVDELEEARRAEPLADLRGGDRPANSTDANRCLLTLDR